MTTRLIEFTEGILVEVGPVRDQKQEMSSAAADRLSKNFDVVAALMQKLAGPVRESLANFSNEMKSPIKVEGAEVELGIGFSAEGDVFVAKATAEASLKITISFKRAGA